MAKIAHERTRIGAKMMKSGNSDDKINTAEFCAKCSIVNRQIMARNFAERKSYEKGIFEKPIY